MTRQRALRLAREWSQGHVCSLRNGEAEEYHAMFVAMLEKSMPNEPLTIEELREMNGEPVWVKQLKGLSVCDTDWAVVEFRLEPDVKHDKIRVWWPGSEDEDTPSEDDYGKTWLAYRRPKEEQ